MMLENKLVIVTIYPTNRKKYEQILNRKLTNAQEIKIEQKELLPTSRTLVTCKCDKCGTLFNRKRVDVKNKTFCSKKCRDDAFINPNPSVEKISVNCTVCNKVVFVFPSKFKKQENFLCSRKCYSKHRSLKYVGNKLYNYQDIYLNCEMCDKEFKSSEWYLENKEHQFCSPECYWEHRRKYYKEFYFNEDLRDRSKETLPEKMVREWLEKNNIKIKQEAGFLRKYFVDFYLPDYKAIIEVNGDYWHINPNIYDLDGNDDNKITLTSQQQEILKNTDDTLRKNELESYGYKVFVLWETDIHENLDELMNKTMVEIKNHYKTRLANKNP